MKVDLNNKTAIITGAGDEIGQALAEKLASSGAAVVLADINEKAIASLAEEITAAGGKALAVKCDVSCPDCVEKMVAKAVESFGSVDILVNKASINGSLSERKTVQDYDVELWQKIMHTDLDGVFYCSRFAAKQMEKQGKGGSIINISSVTGILPVGKMCAYAAAKAGVINLTKAMAVELAPLGIRSNCIAVGFVEEENTKDLFARKEETEQLLLHTPLGRTQKPEDLVGAVCLLAGDGSAYMTGSVTTIDGGLTCSYTRQF